MSKGVFTRSKLFTFVKGMVTNGTPPEGVVACGSGTSYPVVATLDQIAEMFYRVRNTKITGYEVYQEHANYPTLNSKYWALFNSNNIPATNVVRAQGIDFRRGIYLLYDADSNLNGWVANHYGAVYQDVYGTKYADAKDELAMWPPYGASPQNMHHHSSNYFFEETDNYGPYSKRELPANYGGSVNFFPGSVTFAFPRTVAYVGGDYPFSAGVTLYPYITFRDNYWNHTSVFGGEVSSDGYAEVVLSSGTLFIPIYLQPLSGYSAQLVTAPRLEVTEWWPYAKGSPAVPVWDKDTGLKL